MRGKTGADREISVNTYTGGFTTKVRFVAPPIGTTTEALVRAFIGENPHWRKFCLKP